MPMKPKEIISLLKKKGFVEVKGGGKGGHRKFENSGRKPLVLSVMRFYEISCNIF